MAHIEEEPPIWNSFCAALGAEYREHKVIQGISGLEHPVQAIAVDERTNRLILVSAEFNPRIAALMQVDVQATMPGTRVLVARPVALDLGHAFRTLFGHEGGGLDITKLGELASIFGRAAGQEGSPEGSQNQNALVERYGPALGPLFSSIRRSNLPILSHVLNGVQQLAAIDWEALKSPKEHNAQQMTFMLASQFFALDNLAGDRQHGICPVPTYELTDADWDLFEKGKHIDEVRERLKALNIYQYFFPPADSLALGLVEYGKSTEPEIQSGMSIAEKAGHAVSDSALVPGARALPELLEALRATGYVAEGEFTTELTPQGRSVRQTVKVRPSEGLFAKLLGRFSVNANLNAGLSPKDFLGPQ